jgi:hypothetical protein
MNKDQYAKLGKAVFASRRGLEAARKSFFTTIAYGYSDGNFVSQLGEWYEYLRTIQDVIDEDPTLFCPVI